MFRPAFVLACLTTALFVLPAGLAALPGNPAAAATGEADHATTQTTAAGATTCHNVGHYAVAWSQATGLGTIVGVDTARAPSSSAPCGGGPGSGEGAAYCSDLARATCPALTDSVGGCTRYATGRITCTETVASGTTTTFKLWNLVPSGGFLFRVDVFDNTVVTHPAPCTLEDIGSGHCNSERVSGAFTRIDA